MTMRRILTIFSSVIVLTGVLAWNCDLGWAQQAGTKELKYRGGRVTAAEKKAAAMRARNLGLRPGKAPDAALPTPGPAVRGARTMTKGLAAAPMAAGVTLLAAPLAGIEGPGGIPHYFGPYGNWAFSPLPKGPITSVTLDSAG